MVLFSKKIVLSGLFILWASTGFSQTVDLTIQEADSLFLAQNIDLLAERCNISMADAAITQAKLYHNPVISIEENVYNRLNHRYFDFGRNSEQVVNVDQLISIAGQHSDVMMARNQAEQAKASLDVSKSQAWPEVHITGQYDRNADYFPNYFAVGVSLSVPLFNRNQGNIRSAKARIAQCEENYAGAIAKAQNEVAVAKENFIRALSLEKSVSDNFDKENINTLFQSVNENYRKRNGQRQQMNEITNGLATQLNIVSNPFVFNKKLGHFRIKSGRVTTLKQ